jgi:hypothetical protein
MFSRFLNFLFFGVLSLSSASFGARDDLKDLVIVYDVPHHTRQKLFNDVIKDSVPHKSTPDSYHITLGWVEKVDPANYTFLKDRLQYIASQHLPNAHFTPEAAVNLTLGNRTTGTLGLVPTPAEKTHFKYINSLLYTEVRQFNLNYGTAYDIKTFAKPENYTPNITIAKVDHMKTYGLNGNYIVNSVNVKLANKAKFDLLHASTAPQSGVVQPVKLVVNPMTAKEAPSTPAVSSKVNVSKTSTSKKQAAKPAPKKQAKPAPKKQAKPAPRKRVKPAARKKAKPAPRKRVKPAPRKRVKPAPRKRAKPAPRKREKPAPRKKVTRAPKKSSSRNRRPKK